MLCQKVNKFESTLTYILLHNPTSVINILATGRVLILNLGISDI